MILFDENIIVLIFKIMIPRALLIIAILYSCCTHKAPVDCTSRIDCLLLNRIKLQWGETQQRKEYTNYIKLYNPTAKSVFIKLHKKNPLFRIINLNHDSLDISESSFRLAPKTCEMILVIFEPSDTLELGDFLQKLYFEFNGELCLTPLEMNATITEDFDMVKLDKSLPKVEIVQDFFNFDTVAKGKKVSATFQINNSGEGNLIIRKIETTCTCTKYFVTERVVPSGKSMTLNVEYSTMGSTGLQRKFVRIFCNDPTHFVVEFVVQGYVEN